MFTDGARDAGGAAGARRQAPTAGGASSAADPGSGGGGAESTGLVLAWSAASPLDDRPHRGFAHLYAVRLKVTYPDLWTEVHSSKYD